MMSNPEYSKDDRMMLNLEVDGVKYWADFNQLQPLQSDCHGRKNELTDDLLQKLYNRIRCHPRVVANSDGLNNTEAKWGT